MEAARAKVPKHLSALLCVWPGKHLTPKSAHAVLANVDHQVQVVNPAKMVVMAPMVKMVIKEAQAKTPAKKKNCCRFHLNANAEPNPVQLVQLVPKEPMVPPEMQVVQAEMVNLDPKVHLVPLVQRVPQEMLALMVQREKMVIWCQAKKDQLVLPVKPAKLALQVPLAKLANPAKMALPVPLVPLVMLVLPVVQAKLALKVALETQAKLAHLAAANTAHQLVWLQVIKRQRLPSQAMRQKTGRQLGRLFNNDQNHQFVQYISSFTAFFHFFTTPFFVILLSLKL